MSKDEFLKEPVLAHRCQLEDDQVQRERFSKYLDILKNYTATNSSNMSPKLSNLSVSSPSTTPSTNSSPHIAIENYELIVECKRKQLDSVDYQSDKVRNWIFTLRIHEIKRVVSPFKGSPVLSTKTIRTSMLRTPLKNNLQSQLFANGASDSFSSMSATMLTATGGCIPMPSPGMCNNDSTFDVEYGLSNHSGPIARGEAGGRGHHEFDRVASYASNPPVLTITSTSTVQNTPLCKNGFKIKENFIQT